uniref:Uncharacterized protein n=1 Tax=Meloidogyne hapla TaxID=6305 RepID=A0A1I8B1R6_MELHA
MRDPEMSLIQSRKSLERKMFKIRRNVFPPILTNRFPQNSNKRSSKHSKEVRKVRFHVSEPSSSYSQSSGDISSSSNEDQEELCQNIPSTSINSDNSNLNKEENVKFVENKNNFYFKYFNKNYEKDEDEMSDLSFSSNNSSNFVENEWSDLEENNQRSRESEALSIHPELKDLWFLAGITASKQKDWRSARFCFGHCEDEIRKLEALILVNFCEQNFLECSFTLNKLFNIYPRHELGSFIYSFISKCFPLLKEFLDKNLQKGEIKIEEYKFAEQKIIFYMDNTEETQQANDLMQIDEENVNCNNNIPKNITKENCKDNLKEKSSLEQIDGTTTSENEQVNTTFSSDIEIIEEKQLNNNTTKINSQDEYFNGNNKLIKLNRKRILNWAEKTKLKQKYYQKRSQQNREENENASSLRRSERVQNSPRYFNIAESWAWNFTKLMRLANNSLQNRGVLDPLINYRWIEDLPCFNPLIEKFVEASKNENWEFSQYLYKFLEFICEKKNVGLTLGQAEVFRQVYIRWSSTFLNLSTENTSIQTDLLIHQMAAELGSHRALSILQLFFDGEFNFNRNFDFRQKINIQEEKKDDINFDKNNKLDKSQLDLFKWIFERIAKEQKEEKQLSNDSKAMETDIIEASKNNINIPINSVSEKNERLRDLEIRYRWLTSNLQPNELGLLLQQQSSESIHFAYIYCQLKIALNLILKSENNNTVKIFTNANFGINCLSKRNLEEFLKKKIGEYET